MHNTDELQNYKAINFDLNEKLLKQHYPSKSPFGYKKAYSDIKKFMLKQGSSHRQYSGYVSNEPLYNYQLLGIIQKLSKEFPWLKQVVQRFDVTNIGNTWDLTDFISKSQTNNQVVIQQGLVKRTKSKEISKSPVEVFRKQAKERQQQAPPKEQETPKKDNLNL